MAHHHDLHVPIRVNVPPALRARIDAAQAERAQQRGERTNSAMRELGRRMTEAFRPLAQSLGRATMQMEEAVQRAKREADRHRWIDHQLYVRVTRPAQVAAFHRGDDPLPYGPRRTIDLELATARIQLGVEYDSARVSQRIATAYDQAMERLAKLEENHRAWCAANPLNGRLHP